MQRQAPTSPIFDELRGIQRAHGYLPEGELRSLAERLDMVGCPVGSIRRRNSMEIIIEDWCIGCGLCARNCPYGNLNLHPFTVQVPDPAQPARMIATTKKKATGCDLCMEHAEPSCVYACPHDAAHRVEPLTFFAGMDHWVNVMGVGPWYYIDRVKID